MPCPPNEILIAYTAADAEPADHERVAAHLGDGCDACAAEIARIGALRQIARSAALEDPPVGALARAKRIPGEARSSGLGALAGKIAALVFDTVRDPLPIGARAAAAHARQMLFRALDYDIDVRVVPAADGRVRISGQVLPGPDRPLDAVADLEVALLGPETAVAIATTNELGEFDFDSQEEGDYTLSVEAADERLLINNLSARRA